MADDVVLAKVAGIEQCLSWIREDYRDLPERLNDRIIEQAIVLNLHRACQTAIDLAMHVVASRRLGLPHESREAFTLLEQAGLLEPALAARLRNMVGFRNIAVHQYQTLSRPILVSILSSGLSDLEKLCAAMVTAP